MVTLFVIGILVALIIEEFTGYTPGGVIVPGFLALSLGEPVSLVATLIVVLMTCGVYHLLKTRMLLYGRRRFGFLVLTGLVIQGLLVYLLPQAGILPIGLAVVGLVLPGVIAESTMRQGMLPTLLTLVLATCITRLLGLAVLGW